MNVEGKEGGALADATCTRSRLEEGQWQDAQDGSKCPATSARLWPHFAEEPCRELNVSFTQLSLAR